MRRRILILSAVAVAVAVFALVPTSQASAQAGPMTHFVLPGQTLYGIGAMYGTSPWLIAQVNGIVNPNYIRAGQILVIPVSPPPFGWGCGPGTYRVMPGDTLFSIGMRNGVSPWALARLNGLANPNYIRAGQCLRLR